MGVFDNKHAFTDADWASDVLTIFFAAGGPHAWGSRMQAAVATSRMQSKYKGVYSGMQVTVWFRGVLSDFTFFMQTHAFLLRQSKCRGPGAESRLLQEDKRACGPGGRGRPD